MKRRVSVKYLAPLVNSVMLYRIKIEHYEGLMVVLILRTEVVLFLINTPKSI